MKSFDPFSEEGRAWLDYNSEEDEFGAYENLGRGRTRVHSIPKKKKKEKSYVKEKGSDKKGDYLVFGGKRKKRKSRRRKRKSRRKKRKSRRRKRKKGGFCLTKKCKLKKMKKKEEKRYKNFIDETDKERWKLAWEMCDMKNKTDYDNCVNKIVGKSNIIEDIDINFIKNKTNPIIQQPINLPLQTPPGLRKRGSSNLNKRVPPGLKNKIKTNPIYQLGGAKKSRRKKKKKQKNKYNKSKRRRNTY